MEQADARKAHRHAVFITRIDYVVVADGTARLRDEFHTGTLCAFDVVAEREERVASKGYAA